MPRTLPWLQDQAVPKAKTSAAPAIKRVRPVSPDFDLSDNERSAHRALVRQRRQAAQRAGRTPSTSPPPAPPPIE
ncbi:MAG: hypothetical protein L6R39_005768 [Caloplaca ligustica]|nr:MAG: hypothetical protein L6R39_005768 [Caloplaca ligustica]